jgi:arginine N-succinyltransferase
VRKTLGKVGSQVEPVKHMLEHLGFRYVQRIDPFDGGPHYEAKLAEVTLVRDHRPARLGKAPAERSSPAPGMLVGLVRPNGRIRFRAVRCPARFEGDEVRIPEDARKLLGARPGDRVHVVPFD